MIINSIDSLLSQEISNPRNLKMAVAGAADAGVLEAVIKAQKDGVIEALLFGNKEIIIKELTSLRANIKDYHIIDAETDEEAAHLAVAAVREGKARLIMKGFLNTATLLKEIVNKETGFSNGGVISHLILMEIPNYPRLLGITDVGIIPYPTLEQKKGIIKNATTIFRNLGCTEPKVAALSYVENVNPKIPEMVEARELEKMSKSGEIKDCIVEGPLSFDIAISERRALAKGYKGMIIGNADILLMPNISAGNILAKALGEFVPNIKSVAIAIGSDYPIVITSRAASIEGKYNSIIAAAAACK